MSRVGDRAERLISPDLQAERVLQYAASRGFEVEMQEPELDQSGGKIERPILQRVVLAIEKAEFAGIIVAQLDRLSRSLVDSLQTIRRIESAGGQVIAVAENFDAGTPEGRMARNVILAMGEMQLDRYKMQFRQAKRSAVERGIWPTPTPPFGYRVGPERKLVPDQPEKVRRGFQARANGKSWSQVADVLGVGPTNAQKIIANHAYLGELRLGDWLNPDAHEPIVPRDLWEAAQISHPKPPRGNRGPALLSGLVRCASCGFLMTPERHRDLRYRCIPRKAGGRCPAPASISLPRLDELVERSVLAHLEGLVFNSARSTTELTEATERLARAEAELVAFQTVTRVSDIGESSFIAGMQSRVKTVEEARKGLARTRLRNDALPSADLVSEWPHLTVAQQNHVLRGALGAVVVSKGRGLDRVRLLLPDGPDEIRPALP